MQPYSEVVFLETSDVVRIIAPPLGQGELGTSNDKKAIYVDLLAN